MVERKRRQLTICKISRLMSNLLVFVNKTAVILLSTLYLLSFTHIACNPTCQLLCLKMHNYYRALHNSPPLTCDPELAKSAQKWTDEQAAHGQMYRSDVTDKFTENISAKGWGWVGMDKMEGAIPGAVRGWYSEIKNDYNYTTGNGSKGLQVEYFQTVVWKEETKLGCGLNIKQGDQTYVTAHYAPPSHTSADKKFRENVKPREQPGEMQLHK